MPDATDADPASLPPPEIGPADPFTAPPMHPAPEGPATAPGHPAAAGEPVPEPAGASTRSMDTRSLEELFAEIRRSPLDDRPPRRRRRGRVAAVVAAAAVVAGAGVAAFLLLGREGAGAPPTSVPVLVESPPGLVLHSAVYEPGLGVVLVFGGEMGDAASLGSRTGARGELTAETWVYQAGAGWARLATSEVRPAPRAGHAAAFATDAGLMVTFGGSSLAPVNCQRNLVCSDDLLADTWALDPASGQWQERHPASAPSPRMGHVMAYDAAAQRVILFGGTSGGGTWSGNVILGDTWAYDPAADSWEEQAPATAPPGRVFAAMGYDPGSGRVLLWGGASWEDDAAVWAYDYASDTWTSLGDRGAPLARWMAGAAFDTGLEGLVVAGGIAMVTEEIAEGVTATGIRAMDEAWVFRPESATWAPLPPPSTSGVQLQARLAAAYDEAAGAVVIYGGAWTETRTLLFDSAEIAWREAIPEATTTTSTLP